jgi:hypothetical protein
MPGCRDVNWIGTGTRADYSSSNEFKKISGSYDARYYNQIITRLHLQGTEENNYSMQQQQEEEENLHGQKSKKKILLVDDEQDSCLVYEVVLQDAGYRYLIVTLLKLCKNSDLTIMI